MYIRETWKKQSGKTNRWKFVVESFRDKQGKVKHKYLVNLSKLPAELAALIEAFVKKQPVSVGVFAQDPVEVLTALDYGGVAALLHRWNQEQLDHVLGLNSDASDLVKAMVFNRILAPCSKLALREWIGATALPSLLSRSTDDFNDDALYAVMDTLISEKDAIEKRLFEKRTVPPRLILYDITSTYFDGTHADGAAFGYSRDKRQDREQIVIALVTDEAGIPLAHEVYSGDTQDKETVIEQVKQLKERFGILQVIFVGDQGMLTQTNVETILKHGFQYIFGIAPHHIKDLFHRPEVIQLSFEDEFGIVEFTEGESRYIVCHSPARHARAMKHRDRKVQKVTLKLLRISASVEKGRLKDPEKIKARTHRLLAREEVGTLFDFAVSASGQFHFWMKSETGRQKIVQEGFYVLKTSLHDLPKEEVNQAYRDLKWVERDFRVIKSFVEVRPIRHYRDRRIRAHVLICFLACYLAKTSEQLLRQSGIQTEASKVFRDLQQIERCELRVGRKILRRIETVGEREKQWLSALKSEAILKAA